MKILNNPEESTMICELPNGVTVEVMQISLSGNKFEADQDVDEVVNVVKSLPKSILNDKHVQIHRAKIA